MILKSVLRANCPFPPPENGTGHSLLRLLRRSPGYGVGGTPDGEAFDEDDEVNPVGGVNFVPVSTARCLQYN